MAESVEAQFVVYALQSSHSNFTTKSEGTVDVPNSSALFSLSVMLCLYIIRTKALPGS